MSPFDFVNSINSSAKEDLMAGDETKEKEYSAFLTNRSLSYFNDTIHHANLMNMNWHLDSKLQYHYYLNSIKSRVRRSKWHKAMAKDDNLDVIMKAYGCSIKVAEEYIKILTSDQIEILIKKMKGY